MVPETKGKSLAEIEEHFRGKKTTSEKEKVEKIEVVNMQTVL